MKKFTVILVVLVILLLGAGTVLAGGDKVQELNPNYNGDTDSHNVISHCFQNIND